MQADLFVPSSLKPMAPSFRLRRASVTVEELITTVARYLGEERTRESFASFAVTRRIDLDPQAEADFQLLQYGEYLLASAIGAASSRLVLSLLLRKAQCLDQGGAETARRCQCRHPLQPRDPADGARPRAPGHRGLRQGTGAGVLEPPVRRDFRPAARPHPRRHALWPKSCVTSLQYAERNGRDTDAFIAERIAHYTSEDEPFLERFTDRGLVVEVRTNRMPRWWPGHDLHRHHAEREGRRSAGARQCDAGAAACASAPAN